METLQLIGLVGITLTIPMVIMILSVNHVSHLVKLLGFLYSTENLTILHYSGHEDTIKKINDEISPMFKNWINETTAVIVNIHWFNQLNIVVVVLLLSFSGFNLENALFVIVLYISLVVSTVSGIIIIVLQQTRSITANEEAQYIWDLSEIAASLQQLAFGNEGEKLNDSRGNDTRNEHD